MVFDWGGVMSKIKKPKKAKQPKKPFKVKVPKEERPSREVKKALKEASKRKKEFQKRLDKSLGVCAVILCIISSGLDIAIKNKKNKSE